MAPCTEFLLLHLHDDAAKTVDNDEAFIKLMKTVKEQPGCERLLYGHSLEDQNKFYWIIDWTTLADHETLMKLETYPDFVKEIKSYTGPQGMEMLHFDFDPSAPHELITTERPLLEILAVDLKAGMQESQVNEAFGPFRRVMAENGVKSIHGTAKENSNKVVAMVSWASVADHMAAREIDAFKSTIGPIRNLWESVTMNHVQLKEL